MTVKKISQLFVFLILFQPFLLHTAGGEEVVALKDDFADGNITENPSWEAGDMHWYNPFFVEKIGDRYWAGSRRYGSFGTFFSNPVDRSWPLPLDVRNGKLTLSFLALFRTTTVNDALNFNLIGADSVLAFRYTPKGSFIISFMRSYDSKYEKVFSTHARVPKCESGKPVRMVITVGGEERITFNINGKEVYRLDPEELERVDPLLTQFERLAFMGALNVKEQNVPLLVPQMQDTKAFRWITDIEVRGWPARFDNDKFPPLNARSRTVLIFCGFGAIDADIVSGLSSSDWKVTRVYDHEPLRAGKLREFRKYLNPETLRHYQWVILLDINALKLGTRGCISLREYVRTGGNLLILGGISTLNRGKYFSSPLAECLPVTGTDALNTLIPVANNPACTYIYKVIPKGGIKRLNIDDIPVWQGTFGAGRVLVVPWAIVGRPEKPFWKNRKWFLNLVNLATADE